MTSLLQAASILPAPAQFARPGIFPSQPSFPFEARGPERRFGANDLSYPPVSGRRTPCGAPARRFLGMGRAFREAKASPSASSSRRLLVTGGGAPCRPGSAAASRARGRRSRSPPSTPAGRPLVDQDGHTLRPPGGLGIRNRKKFLALKSFRNLGRTYSPQALHQPFRSIGDKTLHFRGAHPHAAMQNLLDHAGECRDKQQGAPARQFRTNSCLDETPSKNSHRIRNGCLELRERTPQIDARSCHQMEKVRVFSGKAKKPESVGNERFFTALPSCFPRHFLCQALPALTRDLRQKRELVGEMAVDRAVVDAGIARELAQTQRFRVFGLEPPECRHNQRRRQVAVTECVSLFRRFLHHSRDIACGLLPSAMI